jgi:hypothetical protein
MNKDLLVNVLILAYVIFPTLFLLNVFYFRNKPVPRFFRVSRIVLYALIGVTLIGLGILSDWPYFLGAVGFFSFAIMSHRDYLQEEKQRARDLLTQELVRKGELRIFAMPPMKEGEK